MPIGLGLALFRALLYPEDLTFVYWFDWASHLSFMLGYAFSTPVDILICLLWVALISFIFLVTYHSLLIKAGLCSLPWPRYARHMFLRVFVVFILLLSPIFIFPWYILLPTLLAYPFLLYLPVSIAYPEQAISQAIKKGLRYSANSYFTLVGLMSMGLLTVAAICQPISGVFSIQNEVPDLLDLIVNGTTPFLDNAGLNSVYWTNLFREVVYLVVLLFTIVFWFVLLSLSYFSMLEKREAVNLKKEGMHYGERSRLKEYIEIQDQ
jgi:hypothetical protein